jgi:hypothetical protein
MFEYELTQGDKQRILAGAIRNMLPCPNVPFSPWFGQDFAYKDGMLCRTQNAPSDQRTYEPLFAIEEIYGMSDKAIWKRVMG